MTTLIRERVDTVAAEAIAGDEGAFASLYSLMGTSVFNLVMRSVHDHEVAEDICQDIWVKVHREIGSLRSSEALSSWVYRIASHACIDYSRSRACRERGSVEISEEMLEAPSDEPEAAVERRSQLRLMWEVLAALPPRQSMALYLKQAEGCSYDEIGRILGCPTSAVETLLFRARHGLARTHERFEDDPAAGCKMMASTMAVVLDREGTPIQERAVEMHVAACKPCRTELAGMKQGMAGYSWLPMLPAGGQALTAALAGSTGAGAGLGVARLVGMLLIKGKASGLAFLTVGAVATTGVAGAAAGVIPGIEAPAAVREVGTSVRNATLGGQEAEQSQSLKAVEDSLPPLAPLQSSTALGSQASQQPLAPITPAGQLDPGSALNGLPGLLEGASEGTLATLEPLLAFVGDTLLGTLGDPLATLQALLTNPGATLNGLTTGATQALNETTQNATMTVDTTFDQTTDVVDGLIGENQLTTTLDGTVNNTTDLVDTTVGGLTDTVDETTGGLGETVDSLLGDEGLLGGDEGLLGGLGGDDPAGGGEEEEGDSVLDEIVDPILDPILDPLLGGGEEEEDEGDTCLLGLLC